jgi:very-short-patch-repair endonuclease
MPVKRKRSDVPTFADTFAALWSRLCVTWPFEREYQFLPDRKFRFDFAWPGCLVAVEMEGGIWVGGSHTRGVRYRSDCEKYNLATLVGWRVLRYTTSDLHSRPFQVVQEVRGLIENRTDASVIGRAA